VPIKAVVATVACSLMALVAACGQPPHTLSTSAGGPGTTSGPAGEQTIHFDGIAFDVPAAWPVFNLVADPHRCARFDQHAVYLGQQGSLASCPARALGRTEAVQVEPVDETKQQQLLPTASTDVANGLQMLVQPSPETTRSLTAQFPQPGVVMTVTFLQDQAQAEQILHSVRRG
jgi:hypothetical protein